MSDDRFKDGDGHEPAPSARLVKRSGRVTYEDVQAFLDKYCAKLGIPRGAAKPKRQAPKPTEKTESMDGEWDKLRKGK